MVTPFSAGSVTDIVARPFAAKFTEAWGQPVVIDNRTGAGGTLAAEFVASSAPDGHTLLIGANGPNAVNPSLIKSMPYDSQRAFAPITLTATNNLLLAVPAALPAKSVRRAAGARGTVAQRFRFCAREVDQFAHRFQIGRAHV